MSTVTNDVHRFSPRRVAELFMFDFEISGIHLDDKLVGFSHLLYMNTPLPLTDCHSFFSPQRKEAVALHVKLLDLSNEFLVGSHMPNRIARSAIPEHLHLQFASEGSFIQVGGLHADSPDDLVGDCSHQQGAPLLLINQFLVYEAHDSYWTLFIILFF